MGQELEEEIHTEADQNGKRYSNAIIMNEIQIKTAMNMDLYLLT